MTTPLSVAVGWDPPQAAVLPVPPELPALPAHPRVLQLVDGDCLSYALAEGTARRRASDQEMQSCLGRVQATARSLDPHARARVAISTKTASHHLGVLTTSSNNLFTIRRGLDGADWALLEELSDLAAARTAATRPGRKRTGPAADLVIFVGHDGIYSAAIRHLRLIGVPCWLLTPGTKVAASLTRAACAVSYIGPRHSS